MTTREDRTFTVPLSCSNCGAKWESDPIPWKAEVAASWHGVTIHPEGCMRSLACVPIGCPTCGRTREVRRRYV